MTVARPPARKTLSCSELAENVAPADKSETMAHLVYETGRGFTPGELPPGSVPDSVVRCWRRPVARWLQSGITQLRAADLRERQKRQRVLKKLLVALVDAKRVPVDIVPLMLRYVGYAAGRDDSPDAHYALLKRWVEAQPRPPAAWTALAPWKRDAVLHQVR